MYREDKIRAQGYAIGQRALLALFNSFAEGYAISINTHIPHDARFRGSYSHHSANCEIFVFEHESFAEQWVGNETPIVHVDMERPFFKQYAIVDENAVELNKLVVAVKPKTSKHIDKARRQILEALEARGMTNHEAASMVTIVSNL